MKKVKVCNQCWEEKCRCNNRHAVEVLRCSSCDDDVEPEDNYCSQCGYELEVKYLD